jgi:hypothetical protein
MVLIIFVRPTIDNPSEEVKFDFCDPEGSCLNIRNIRPNSGKILEIPAVIENILEHAETLFRVYPHFGVDMYNSQGKISFGELMFHHVSGDLGCKLKEWDEMLGDWIHLPLKKHRRKKRTTKERGQITCILAF